MYPFLQSMMQDARICQVRRQVKRHPHTRAHSRAYTHTHAHTHAHARTRTHAYRRKCGGEIMEVRKCSRLKLKHINPS